MPSPTLPAWAVPHPSADNVVLVDPDLAYPALLREIAANSEAIDRTTRSRYPLDPRKPSRYWLEVAYQFIKLDLQTAMGRFGFAIHIRSDDGRKLRWNHTMFPGTAADVQRAAHGREARRHYLGVRGPLPHFRGR